MKKTSYAKTVGYNPKPKGKRKNPGGAKWYGRAVNKSGLKG